jgi:hypothetical protein
MTRISAEMSRRQTVLEDCLSVHPGMVHAASSSTVAIAGDWHPL